MSVKAVVDRVLGAVRPGIPGWMNEIVKGIIEKGWAVNPDVRYSFDEIWSRLHAINFQLTPNVNCAKVAEFIASVRKAVPLPEPQPITDLRSYTFRAPQQGFDRSFALQCTPLATVEGVRKKVAAELGVFDHEKHVQLLFGGRVLRDPLVLDNLQIREDDVIVVHVRKRDDPGFESSRSVRLSYATKG
jgi:hypothetical protein